MAGEFTASPEFDFDELRTAEEIQRSGEETLQWLRDVAASESPREVGPELINEIHRRWFETTFPADAGRYRQGMVLNRKASAVTVEAILPAVVDACETWRWRRANAAPEDPVEQVEFAIQEANTLTVRVYDVHPYLDGNTRTTWHLRNYLLMLDGLRPLLELADQSGYEAAWWEATPQDHARLDEYVTAELLAQDR